VIDVYRVRVRATDELGREREFAEFITATSADEAGALVEARVGLRRLAITYVGAAQRGRWEPIPGDK